MSDLDRLARLSGMATKTNRPANGRSAELSSQPTTAVDLSDGICDRPSRQTRLLTVIAGPHEGDGCVLYTAHGGPAAPREPWDPSLNDDAAALEESRAFWSVHALSA